MIVNTELLITTQVIGNQHHLFQYGNELLLSIIYFFTLIMPKYILYIALFFLFSNLYGQSTQDSVAIVRLLKKESATWRSGEVKAHADCWQIRPYSSILISTGDGKVLDIPPSLIINPSADMVGKGGQAILSNFKISIHRNNAWVSHDEISISKDGKKAYSKEIRILEKVKHQWKLVGQSIHAYSEQDTPPF